MLAGLTSFLLSQQTRALAISASGRRTLSDTNALQQQLPNPLCDLILPEGRCVGVKLIDDLPPQLDGSEPWLLSALHPKEVEYGFNNVSAASTRTSFWMGRYALRKALLLGSTSTSTIQQQLVDTPVLKDSHGRPQLPEGTMGSISHKSNVAVALVQQCQNHQRTAIGVDIESTVINNPKIVSKVLTPTERAELGRIPGITIDQEVLLRFSLKEAAYKAIHPLCCEFIGFQQAEMRPLPDGTAQLRLLVDAPTKTKHTLQSCSATWRRIDADGSNGNSDFFLTTAQARLYGTAGVDVD